MAEQGQTEAPHPRVCAPERLGPHHDLALFETGRHPWLNEWLKRRALASEGLSARTYVVCAADQPTRVVGYYALSTAMERRALLPTARLRSGTPDEVPLLLIGRLAIDQAWQGRGLGSALVADALRRCRAAADIAGIRAVIVHPIDDDATQFLGFIPSPLGPRVLIMPIETVRSVLSG